jgi:hypothetical protein
MIVARFALRVQSLDRRQRDPLAVDQPDVLRRVAETERPAEILGARAEVARATDFVPIAPTRNRQRDHPIQDRARVDRFEIVLELARARAVPHAAAGGDRAAGGQRNVGMQPKPADRPRQEQIRGVCIGWPTWNWRQNTRSIGSH